MTDPLTLPDDQYRRQIVSELKSTMLVEAAAGTGKTTCLVARMVELLRTGECTIESMAAVTFTRKAAAELRTRFQLKLKEEASSGEGIERTRLLDAVAQIERCLIGTIHSFCARVLRERPVEAGVDPGFAELDEALDRSLKEQAWREHVAALIATDDQLLPQLQDLGLKLSSTTRRSNSVLNELDELGLEPVELGPAFMNFSEYRDVEDWPAEPVTLPDLDPCREALNEYVAHMGTFEFPRERGRDKLMSRYEDICRRWQLLDLEKPVELMELLEQFDRSSGIVLSMWPDGMDQGRQERGRWDNFRADHAGPTLRRWREHRYHTVMRVIQPARDIYDRFRLDRNALNFQDLLLLTARLLRDQPEVRRYFRHRFSHLLIDEFQDTDPLQAEILMLLTAQDSEERDWQKCCPVVGSLFVVGDPKQSIYRFRRADILTYNRVRSIIERVGGQVVPLTTNFRSTKSVIDWINGCFDTVFPESGNDHSPANRQLDVGRCEQAPVDSGVYRFAIPGTVQTNYQVAEYEAEQIARFIRQAIDEKRTIPRTDSEKKAGFPDHAQPGDFMLVTRKKVRLTVYARKLQLYGLPYGVTGGSGLKAVPELQLLSLCLNAVIRSDDAVALVAVLRSELFGIADTTLYDFRRQGGRFSYYSDVPDLSTGEDRTSLSEAFQRLRLYSKWLRQMPASAAVERVADDLGLIALAGANETGSADAGGLLKAIEILRAAEDVGTVSVGDSVALMERLAVGEEKHDSISAFPSVDEPVRLMNIHQCKGLEAPIVFLADPSGHRQYNVGLHIDRSGASPRGFVAIRGHKRGEFGPAPLLAQPVEWDELAQTEQRFLDAESQRLLYVAATRAGHQLVISQRSGNGNRKNPWQLFDNHLETDFPEVGDVTSPERNESPVNAQHWLDEVHAMSDRWKASASSTYQTKAIKASAIQPGPKPHGTESAGAEWGQAIHTLLEAAMTCPEVGLERTAMSALEAEGLPLHQKDDLVRTVRGVLASELWQRARDSEQCLTEVPIATHSSEDGLPTVLRGVIDLIFRESDGWVIVDYKSERVGPDSIPNLAAYYGPQILAYARVWEAITGQPVVEAGLLFTHTNQFMKLALNRKES